MQSDLQRARREMGEYARAPYQALTNLPARECVGDVTAYLAGRMQLRWLESEQANADYDRTYLERVAAHETGHVVALCCYGAMASIAGVLAGPEGGLVVQKLESMEKPHSQSDVPAMVRSMILSAAGHVGERVLFGEREVTAPLEMGYVMFCCLLIGANFSITAQQALRATLGECERMILENEAGAKALRAKLRKDREASADDVVEHLGSAPRTGFERWLAVAQDPQASCFPAAERDLTICGYFASAAQSYYERQTRPVIVEAA